MERKSNTLNKKSWRKFFSDKLTFVALIFIFLLFILSVFPYQFMIDNSPNASGQMHVEISMLNPGSKITMLNIPLNIDEINDQNLINKFFFGTESNMYSIPISSYSILDSGISYRVYNSNQQGVYYGNDYNLEEKTYYLGSDKYGRDFLSRVICGTRVSFSVGFISVLISLFIGVLLGSIAGFFRGKIDQIIMWMINVVWSIPTLLMVISVSLILGKGFWQVFIAVGLTMWVDIARIVRGQFLLEREKEYVDAGRSLAFSNFRIIFIHILPNIVSPVIVVCAANFAAAILLESGLSFLGFGVQPPLPSWGSIIKDHYHYIIMDKIYLAIIPGVSIILSVLAFMILGNGVQKSFESS